MYRRALVFFSVLLSLSVAYADWRVEPMVRLTNRLLFLIDTSGSMKGAAITKAENQVLNMVEQETDDTQFGMITFSGDGISRWEGIPEPDAPKPILAGWAALPSKEARDKAAEWLARHSADGDTPVIQALQAGFADPMLKVSLVLISDGVFYEDVSVYVGTIQAGQANRKKLNLDDAVVMAYCVQSQSSYMEMIGTLGKGGAYFEGYTAAPVPTEQTQPPTVFPGPIGPGIQNSPR